VTCRARPLDPDLYERATRQVKATVRRWPSAYASGLVVQAYKAVGGQYGGCGRSDAGLTRWFRERWVDVCRPRLPPCGRPAAGATERAYRRAYPKCRPLAVAQRMSRGERKAACERKRAAVAKAGDRVVWVR
jgi:hypothetical protein